MPIINVYYFNPILNEESTMLLSIETIAKIEALGQECCVMTLTTQTEKIAILETLTEIEEKIHWANQPDSLPASMQGNPWLKK